MGSYNNYQTPDPKQELNQKQDTGQERQQDETPVISMLINSIYYFIDCVFILREKDNYRLVALQHSRVLCDNRYRTPGGCRIAFNKLYDYKAWDKQVKANWSPFYDPDKPWWGKKSTIMKTGKRQEDQQ